MKATLVRSDYDIKAVIGASPDGVTHLAPIATTSMYGTLWKWIRSYLVEVDKVPVAEVEDVVEVVVLPRDQPHTLQAVRSSAARTTGR
eukprot:7154658-Pyramimonas_sp.AAC.1